MRILFFTPFANRNGAEMMLWYLIKHADPKKFSFAVYSEHQGSLLSELPESVPYYLPSSVQTLPKSLIGKILKKVRGKIYGENIEEVDAWKKSILDIHNEFKPDVWYINTILCSKFSDLATELKIPFIIHFHELLSLYEHVPYQSMKNMMENASIVIGCSQAVCEKLKVMGGKNIALQYECIEVDHVKKNDKNVKAIRDKLGIGQSTFIWVMSGAVAYRKGTDLIPAIAKRFDEDMMMVWLGPGSSGYSYYVEQELKYYNVSNVLLLGPKSDDYYDYLAVANGLALTSREDPFPLVMIEAAALGKPIVAFNSGGVQEFVQEKMGLVTEGFSLDDLVGAMKKVMSNEIEFDKDISINRANEFDVGVQGESWQSLLLKQFT